NETHGAGGLLGPHHRRLRIGPGETETRMKAAAAHAVVARPEGGTAIQGDLRYRGTGYRLDHLRTMLDDTGLFVGLADDEPRGVVQIEDRRARLAAGLYEVGGLGGAGGIDGPVIGDDTHGPVFDLRMTA